MLSTVKEILGVGSRSEKRFSKIPRKYSVLPVIHIHFSKPILVSTDASPNGTIMLPKMDNKSEKLVCYILEILPVAERIGKGLVHVFTIKEFHQYGNSFHFIHQP